MCVCVCVCVCVVIFGRLDSIFFLLQRFSVVEFSNK